jgi:integrase
MLRKTAFTRMANDGVDLLTLCAIAGHSNIEITRKYYLKRDAKENARDIAIKYNQKSENSEDKK